MVRKKLAVAILALSALQASIAGAMGLGNLSVRSALNQPLNAEIKLIDTGDLDPTQIKIRLAAPEDFQRAGVDRDFFLTNLRFDVEMDGRGGATVRITTREPVVEPYLNFVLEARWPSGRLLREFAVLLDPPTFSANRAAAPVTSAAVAQPVKPRAVQPPTVKTETGAATTVPPADMSLPAAASGEYRVQVYDTLSKIAARFKPANDVSVAQTMIAIQRANPQVFIRNNVNLIKSGYVLRLPSADEVRALSAEQAAQEVDTQTREWRGGASASAARSPAAGPQLDASAPTPAQKDEGFREQARLSIATTGDAEKGGGGGGSGKGTDALRQQLTQSQEALEKGRRDNKELQSRLDDMERQVATLQRLISLKDDQMAALQTQQPGGKTAPQPAPEAADKAATTTPAGDTPSAEAPTSTEVAATPAPVVNPAPVAAKPVPKPAPKPATASVKAEETKYYLYGGIAALVLALAGLLAYIKRRKATAEEESDAPPFDDDSYRFDIDTLDSSAPVETTAASGETKTADLPDEVAPEAPKKAVRSETGDPIAESDIYIAYGRYQQAVDLLTHAIDAEPQRSDLRVKLLEVYVEMRNKDAFRQQFVGLQGLGDTDAIAKVKDLLSSVDGIADWLDGLPGAPSGTLSAAPAAMVAASAAAASVGPDLDLDLDLELEEEPAPTETSVAQAASFDGGWSDDLAALEPTESIEEAAIELDLDGDFGSTDIGAELSDAFRNDAEADTPSYIAGFETAKSATSTSSLEASDFNISDFDAPRGDAGSSASANADDRNLTSFEEGGLELDLGDDDLDQALRNMGDTGNLDDLEDMSAALGTLDAQTDSAAVDLSADFGELPEEFDLSQPGTGLPEVDRASGGSFGELDLNDASFEEASLEEARFAETDIEDAGLELPSEPQPEIDVFAGLNQPAPAPVSASPSSALDSGDDFDFLADADEVATKLDLARAYIDMGDTEGAKDILDEVLQEGTDTQRDEASTLLSRIG